MTESLLTAVAISVAVFLLGRILLSRLDRIPGSRARAEVQAGAVLLDVRTVGEFAGGSLPGARNIPLGELEGRLEDLDRDQAVVVFCASGMRSARAAGVLRKAGFTAHDLGPRSAW